MANWSFTKCIQTFSLFKLKVTLTELFHLYYLHLYSHINSYLTLPLPCSPCLFLSCTLPLYISISESVTALWLCLLCFSFFLKPLYISPFAPFPHPPDHLSNCVFCVCLTCVLFVIYFAAGISFVLQVLRVARCRFKLPLLILFLLSLFPLLHKVACRQSWWQATSTKR